MNTAFYTGAILCEISNPSDPYTLRTDDFLSAAVAVAILGNGAYGLSAVDDSDHSPVLFGWDAWLEDRGVPIDEWLKDPERLDAMASALETVLIGKASDRADVESALQRMESSDVEAWLAERHDRHRSSMNDIGKRATELASDLRRMIRDLKPA